MKARGTVHCVHALACLRVFPGVCICVFNGLMASLSTAKELEEAKELQEDERSKTGQPRHIWNNHHHIFTPYTYRLITPQCIPHSNSIFVLNCKELRWNGFLLHPGQCLNAVLMFGQ